MDYKKRLLISTEGNTETEFYTVNNLFVAKGYERIVIGERGPYIEFNESQINQDNILIPEDQKWRLNNNSIYYVEFRTDDISNVKIYYQIKTVDYADYLIDKFYISPFDICVNGKLVIEKY